MTDHGHCPNCGTNLNGGLIFETFMEKYNDRAKALETAAMYGATETTGQWGRVIALYDRDEDRTVAFKCPDCNHEWKRK